MLTRRITYKLYPSTQQEATLHVWRRMHCNLYNAAVANRKTQYQKLGHSVDYFEQQNCLPAFKKVWTEYKVLGSQALQATLKRVDIAFQRFFKGFCGYPKFKSIRHYSGWTYPAKSGWDAETDGGNGHLNLSKLGRMQMRGQARTWGTPTTCTIIYRNGQWYASITVNCEPVRETGSDAVGIDLGCKEAITLSTGEQISKPEFIKVGQRKVKVARKKLRRKRSPNRDKKIKASRRWKKERQAVSKLQRKVTRQREDWLHKTTSNIVSSNSLVAGEVGFGMIGKMLDYKLSEAGGFYVESPTRQLKPSQRCSKCWELTPKTLVDRVHVCSNPQCGHTEDRDINAAQVNLIWAQGLGTSLSDAESSSSTSCGSMRQLGAKKRQKSQSIGEGETSSAYAVG
jgi:putative transposase